MVASPEPQRAPRRRVRPLLLVCLILLALVFIAAAVLSAFWLRYEEPGIPGQVIPALSATQDDSGKAGSGVGSSGAEAGAVAETAQGELALDEASVVPAVRRWFGQWVEQHRSLTVSPSFQLSGGSASQIQWLGLADERSQETIGNRAWVQVDVGLHPRLPAIEHFTSSAFTGQSTVLYRQGSRIVGQLVSSAVPHGRWLPRHQRDHTCPVPDQHRSESAGGATGRDPAGHLCARDLPDPRGRARRHL